ncbi:glycosyltransferase [Flavivirga jejuensis]|uniref:Glycosyltransferase n=1 Tax=Flavivirga jejuensis TaxID=870487 RepID=A0ABT8WK80_9FLAO|nr:glycosyltransferase [Flavivirga jejuensis]MDO5973566.1 glycosyltransferase [Flavivirga jejuensis]
MKKICIITTSLGKGGAERFSALLSQMLSELEYEVHIMMTKNDIDYAFFGEMFNLQQEFGDNISDFKKIKVLRSYFKKHAFDVIIDNRTRNKFLKEFILYHYVFKAKKMISIVHSYYLLNYLPRSKFLAKLLYKNKTKIITVSKEIQETVISSYGFKDCGHIYNPVDVEKIDKGASQEVAISGDFILSYGRIDEPVKNFTLLLKAYKKSFLHQKGIKLYVIGGGKDVIFLKEKIRELALEDHVDYIPFVNNPFPYVKKALFTVLTSRHEGFPMVLLEALACQTPVISVNCKSGPKEIIQHGANGLIVENYNAEALANALNTLVDDKSLYTKCKANAKNSIDKFSIEKITKEWENLLR